MLDERWLLFYELTKNDDDVLLSILQKVAKALNKQDMSEYLSVTEDFVLFPTDSEGNIEANMKASIPAEN